MSSQPELIVICDSPDRDLDSSHGPSGEEEDLFSEPTGPGPSEAVEDLARLLDDDLDVLNDVDLFSTQVTGVSRKRQREIIEDDLDVYDSTTQVTGVSEEAVVGVDEEAFFSSISANLEKLVACSTPEKSSAFLLRVREEVARAENALSPKKLKLGVCPSSSSSTSSSSHSTSRQAPLGPSYSFSTLSSSPSTSGQAPLDGCHEFSGLGHPHSGRVLEVFHTNLRLTAFRPYQLESVNAALLGYDTLVIMPTGGGKSLCYQIPAAVNHGVTVVVSPLNSLIADQVMKMKSAGINARALNRDVPSADIASLFKDLSLYTPTTKLLYVTPESVLNNPRLQEKLKLLNSKNKLCRFVIDEAHCILQWGQQFRREYGSLNLIRHRYPRVPIMALSATATPTGMVEIVHALGMKHTKTFTTSVNRPNLQYTVQPKTKMSMNLIVDTILNDFDGCSGILYCATRTECEAAAKQLAQCGITALPYHAGLSSAVRATTQNEWLSSKVMVLAATVAFGMGVDKADVRFVIHLSMAKSMETYQQETGRAGRDRKPSKCITFYHFQDCRKLTNLILSNNSDVNEGELKRLLDVLNFLENKVECRRVMLAQYFGETINKCTDELSKCDNCKAGRKGPTPFTVDVTKEARDTLQCLPAVLVSGDFTMNHVVRVLKGRMVKKIVNAGHDIQKAHGLLKNWEESDIEKLIYLLLMRGHFSIKSVVSFLQMKHNYLKMGCKLLDASFKFEMPRYK